jgi:hypothetical protein
LTDHLRKCSSRLERRTLCIAAQLSVSVGHCLAAALWILSHSSEMRLIVKQYAETSKSVHGWHIEPCLF